MRKFAAAGLVAALVSAPLAASTYGVELRGHVPVSCHVTGSAAMIELADGIADLGTVREFCNNAAGYTLLLDYAPQLAGAVVTIDGTSVVLDGAGTASLAAEAGPALKTRAISIDLTGAADTADPAISFRIVPR